MANNTPDKLTRDMKYDVIIIGSGLGGLECAYILSKAGRSVLVLEQSAHAGGCMQSYKRHGLAFDTGFHYVGGLAEGQSLHGIFSHLGLMRLPWQRLDQHFDRITIEGQEFVFAEGYEEFADTLASYFPTERKALHEYATLLRQAMEQAITPFAFAKESNYEFLAGTGAWQYLNTTFRDPMLINVLSGTSLKMELRKESLPLFTFVHGNSSFIESSWRLKGDSSMIVDTLLNGIHAQGGKIICQAEVEELVEKDGCLVQARCTNGEVYEGDLFISDIHPAQTCALVKHSTTMKNTYRKRIDGLENTFGMFTVSIRLKPGMQKYFNWNRYIYRRPDVWDFYRKGGKVAGLLASCRVPEDGGEYADRIDLLTPMLWDTCKRWNGTRVGHRDQDYEALKARLADECLELAECSIPGLRNAVEEMVTSTPLTYSAYTHTPQGSAYGIRKDFNNPLTTILSVRTPIPNLLLTGQNLMLHGVHGVTMTALQTCAAILGQEHIIKITKT